MIKRHRTSQLAVILIVLTSACARSDAPAGTVERDSAGVHIVENDHRRPAWTAETAWRLSDAPVVTIGAVAGDSAYLLYQVPYATRLRNGHIAVVNSGSGEVRLFDEGGGFLESIGGLGDGPGEFQSPWAVYEITGDSLAVVDLGREISIFDLDGTFARRFLPQRPDDRPFGEGFEPEGRFGDGSLLFKRHHPQDQSATGVRRSRVQMVRLLVEGGAVQPIGDFDDQTGLFGSPAQYIFGPWAHEAAADSTMWYGPGDRFELREVNLDGETVRLVRLDRPARPVTDDDVNAFVGDIIRSVAGTPREGFTRRLFSDPQHPTDFPAHFAIRVDAGGNLWVQDYEPFNQRVERTWSVFDARGHYLGDVVVPAGLQVTDIGNDYLLGIYRDDLDVEYVHMYRLEKP